MEIGPAAVERGRVLLESRSNGEQKTGNGVSAYLWARGFDLPRTKVKAALISEFARLLKRRRRAAQLDYDHRDRANLSQRELAIQLKRLGQLDPRLEKLRFDLAPESVLEMVSRLTWGLDQNEHVTEVIQRFLPPGLLDQQTRLKAVQRRSWPMYRKPTWRRLVKGTSIT